MDFLLMVCPGSSYNLPLLNKVFSLPSFFGGLLFFFFLHFSCWRHLGWEVLQNTGWQARCSFRLLPSCLHLLLRTRGSDSGRQWLTGCRAVPLSTVGVSCSRELADSLGELGALEKAPWGTTTEPVCLHRLPLLSKMDLNQRLLPFSFLVPGEDEAGMLTGANG